MSDRHISILYTMPGSVYLTLPGVDCWDEVRDARNWPGGNPVVAHPPCRLWSRMRGLSKAPFEEKELARHAVRCVREWGGVLEHPEISTLWADQSLPMPGKGRSLEYTLCVPQFWWVHCMKKWTWLYCVGVPMVLLPPIPLVLGEATHTMAVGRGRRQRKSAAPERARSATPIAFAEWLVAAARQSQGGLQCST